MLAPTVPSSTTSRSPSPRCRSSSSGRWRWPRPAIPGVRVTPFGQQGDGNFHFNLSGPPGADPAAFLALKPEITPRIHDLAVEMEGSFSAEHGIGQLKKPELARYRSATDLALMAALKQALDPKGIMNPGKVV